MQELQQGGYGQYNSTMAGDYSQVGQFGAAQPGLPMGMQAMHSTYQPGMDGQPAMAPAPQATPQGYGYEGQMQQSGEYCSISCITLV